MAALTLLRETYRDKVYGGWLGKSIGVTLGAPYAGSKDPATVDGYRQTPGQADASDLLDTQLVWLRALRSNGIEFTSEQLAQEWQEHISYPWDEYGYAAYNLRRGLFPPVSGAFDNWFREGTASAGRCEIWAMIAPGSPQVAAELAYRDGVLDHAEEGVWAGMLWAAMESAAFFVTDPRRLLSIGLAMVPATCRVAQAARSAQDSAAAQSSLMEARARILALVGRENTTDVAQNVGFAALGLLYGGGDFGASLGVAVGCGYDSDFSGAALGALLGIRSGRAGIPERWAKPIGESIVVGWGLTGFEPELTLDDLTDHTVAVGEQVVAARCPDVELVDEMPAPEPAPGPAPEPGAPPAPTAPVAADTSSPETVPATEPEQEDGAVPAAETGSAAESAEEAPAAIPAAPVSDDQASASAAEATPAVADAPAESAGAAAQDVPAAEGAVPVEASPSVVPAPPVGETAPVQAPPSVADATPAAVRDAVDWLANDQVKELLVKPPMVATCQGGSFEVTVDYGETGPVILPGVARSLLVSVRNTAEQPFIGRVTLSVPQGWQLAVPGAQGQRQMLAPGGMARFGFVVRVPDGVAAKAKNPITVVLTPEAGQPTTCDLFLLGGTCWWFVGPFRNMADEGFDRSYEPEDKPGLEAAYLARDGGLVRWQKLAFAGTVMPLEQELMTGQPGVVYGMTTLHVPAPTDAKLVAHTNDGVHVWLNGRRVIRRHSHEPFRPTLGYGPATADVLLPAGDSKVMVKVVRCGSPVEFSFTAADRAGRPLLDVGQTVW